MYSILIILVPQIFPDLPAQIGSVLFLTCKYKFMLPKYSGMYGLQLEHGQLIRGCSLRKSHLSLSQQ